jgi:hypothetical protein
MVTVSSNLGIWVRRCGASATQRRGDGIARDCQTQNEPLRLVNTYKSYPLTLKYLFLSPKKNGIRELTVFLRCISMSPQFTGWNLRQSFKER